jgi:hypothetical protein
MGNPKSKKKSKYPNPKKKSDFGFFGILFGFRVSHPNPI